MSSLLRVSDFCRPPPTIVDNHHPQHNDNDAIRFRQIRRRGECSFLDHHQQQTPPLLIRDGSMAWASLTFLRRHGLVHGRLVEITYRSEVSIVVRIYTRPLGDDDLVVELSPLAYSNLVARSSLSSETTWNDQDEYAVRQGKISLLETSSLIVAPKVTLRQWKQKTVPILDDNAHQQQQCQSSPPLPQDQSILTVGGWVVSSSSSSSSSSNKYKDAILVFYEVMEITNEKDEVISSSNRQEIFLSNTTTHFRLQDHGSLAFTTCPVMPDTLRMEQILLSQKDEEMQSTTSVIPTPPHPNRVAFAQAWKSIPPNRVTTPAECIWNIVGNAKDYYLQEAIQTAAAGNRQPIFVQGLALYAYQSGKQQLVAGGGLADKLAGLQQALHDARAAAPSILVLHDLDLELCAVQQDARLRHDQESRVLSILLQELDMQNNPVVGSQLSTVPAVLCVLATRRPLPPGPLRQHLVWDSLSLRLPNVEYRIHLWERTMREPPTAVMLQLLDGRTAREIETLARKVQIVQQQQAEDNQQQQVELLLQDACDAEDRQTRLLSNNNNASTHVPSVHWSDIGGLAHVRREIMDAIELPLAHPHLFPKGTSRSGILLFGPPGTGKTLVAKAVATECKLPFLSVKGPELLGSYVGESEANVRNIFQEARERGSRNKPPAAVLFFDEMESLAPKRGEQASGGGNVMDRVVATLFAEMDRNSMVCQTFCIGATNRPDLLDGAMLRPGRFDRLVYLGIQKSDYTKILTAQLRNVKVEGDLEVIANAVAEVLPPSMTGADLSGIVSTALLRATHRLCEKADREVERLHKAGKDASLDMVLRNWTDEEAEPTVVLPDLISAATEATPSLTESELSRYDNLRQTMNVT